MAVPCDDEPDSSLASRAAGGDGRALDALVVRWRDRVFRLAHRVLRRPEDADDVAQEVFLKMVRSIGTYRSDAPFEHWLLRIATNTCRDHLRERRRRPAAVLADMTDDASAWLDRALSGASLAATEAESARILASNLLDTLHPKDRMILVLLDLEGRSTEEIAAILGSTRAAIKVRAMRARRALRQLTERLPRRTR
jgi:RNA polymerase sigma-70 factor (ECF subfamily)